jgi:hypothetical protein
LLIRAAQNRTVTDDQEQRTHLWDCVAAAAPMGTIDIAVSATEHRAARHAHLVIRTHTVTIHAPHGKKVPPCDFPTVHAVYAQETAPPDQEQPLEWLLLTTLNVTTHADAVRVIEYYKTRWCIEVFFKTLKQGCQIEDRHFETRTRMELCIAIYLIITWRVLFLMALGRRCPTLPSDILFTREELTALIAVYHRRKMTEIPSLSEALAMVASFGGYLNRAHDGPPGPSTLWIGLGRLVDFTIGYRSFQSLVETCV